MLVALAGCTEAVPERHQSADFSKVPWWSIGSVWTYATDDGQSRVSYHYLGKENVQGKVTRRVQLEVSDADGDKSTETIWFTDEGLAPIQGRTGFLGSTADCGGLFPLVNRTIVCTETTGSTTSVANRTIRVGPPGSVLTPAGTFDSVEVAWWATNGEEPEKAYWYAPTVGWYSKFFDPAGKTLFLQDFHS
ncbi:MAG TPA: hypothetical protein VM327_06175 [Candidatus Thermoplasmatota archaeon]|nr:hypothetical protein [Candidatus Thermoplasmatota archaeon]